MIDSNIHSIYLDWRAKNSDDKPGGVSKVSIGKLTVVMSPMADGSKGRSDGEFDAIEFIYESIPVFPSFFYNEVHLVLIDKAFEMSRFSEAFRSDRVLKNFLSLLSPSLP
jgi:hypothetical protein